MKPSYKDANFIASSKFVVSHQDLSGCGKWTFLSRIELRRYLIPCGVWHKSQPLRQFYSLLTSAILHQMETELPKWVDPQSMDPVAIPNMFKLASAHVLHLSPSAPLEDLELNALRVIFDYAETVSRRHAKASRSKLPQNHILWMESDREPDYPEPDFRNICMNSATNRHRKAILLIMRFPGPYDGSAEGMFERYLWTAFKILFHGARVTLSSNDDSQGIYVPFPLLFICESPHFTDEMRAKMAKAVHPTLSRVVSLYGQRETLPAHCFIYGIHLSQTVASVVVHFPISVASQGGFTAREFCQVTIAEFLISPNPKGYNDQSDMFIYRWRFMIALFAILRHVQYLTNKTKAAFPNFNLPEEHPINTLSQSHMFHYQNTNSSTRFAAMSSTWNSERFSVPVDWIMPDDLSITTTNPKYQEDMGTLITRQIAQISYHCIRKYLTPLSRTSVLQNHLSSHVIGPDFILPPHAPRARFYDMSKEPADVDVSTGPHFHKSRDFLVMSVPTLEDVNIFIANVFAGFSPYAVHWRPTIRYPFPVSERQSDLLVVDFALTPSVVPPIMKITIARAQSVPLTISSPAVLLGVRSRRHDEAHKEYISDEEMEALSEAIEPHVCLFDLLERRRDVIILCGEAQVDAHPTLFCTYVKMGFLHIIAFAYDEDRASKVSHHIVDSLPFAPDCLTEQELYNRLRIVIALFTLQRQVANICEQWGLIRWPQDLLDDEYADITEVTGLVTPTPSDEGSESAPVWDDWDDLSDDDMEDDPEVVEILVARSVERVTAWLARAEPLRQL